MSFGTLFFDFKKIKRDYRYASGSKFMGDAHMGFFDKTIVGSRKNYNRKAASC